MQQITQNCIGGLRCRFATLSNAAQFSKAVILMHGFGAPGDDLVGLVPFWQQHCRGLISKTVFVFPEAPLVLDFGYDARAWWPINFERLQELALADNFGDLEEFAPDELESCRSNINTVIEHVQHEYSLTPQQIAVGGFSQGAMLAVDVALNYDVDLGGLIVWSGTVINRSQWQARARLRAQVPVIQSHGRLDPILPYSGAEKLRDLLQAGGMSVEFHPFYGPHTIGPEILKSTAKFLS